jgi:dihydroorotate dehydrogenase electron transfer subunit
MKKYVLDLKVVSVEALSDKHVLIKLTDEKPLPEILPGQFVEVRVDHSPTTMLRRPISINFVDRENNQLWLLVAMVGDGTRQLGQLKEPEISARRWWRRCGSAPLFRKTHQGFRG